MADDQDGQQQAGEHEAPAGFQPITSQDELNRLIGERVARAKAKYGDYDDLKTKAARLDEIEQASKSEAEKTADRIAALERELNESRTSALRSRIQAKFGVDDEDAALFLTATDEETLTKQAERLAERRTKTANRDPFAGRTPKTSSGDEDLRDFTRRLFESAD